MIVIRVWASACITDMLKGNPNLLERARKDSVSDRPRHKVPGPPPDAGSRARESLLMRAHPGRLPRQPLGAA